MVGLQWVSLKGEYAFLSVGGTARGIIAIGGVAHGFVAGGGALSVGVSSIGTNALGSVIAPGLNAAAPSTLSILQGPGVANADRVRGGGGWV